MINEYLSYLQARRQSPNTVHLRSVYIRQLAEELELLEATTAQLRRWIIRRANEGDWKPSTVNVATSTLRSFYGWAHEMRYIAENPALPIRPIVVPPSRARMATAEQIAAGIASPNPSTRALVLLGGECGLRVHEMAKLHTRDRDGEWLSILGKGGRLRVVHTSPELLELLDGLEEAHGSGYYFRSPKGGHITAEAARKRIRRATSVNPHALRHRAGTTVYRGTGNNLRVTQVFLGHRYPATTAIYVHVERDDLLAASAAARIAA